MKIRTFEQTHEGPRSKETNIVKDITPKQIRRSTGREYKAVERSTYKKRLAEIFYQNELAENKKTTDEIRDQLIREYRHMQRLRIRLMNHKYTIGGFRNMYNRGTLYSAQPPTFLLSWFYNRLGYIELGGAKKKGSHAFFEDCYHHCLKLKVADPRFVPHEYIVEIRNRQNDGIAEWLEWVVPTDEEIQAVTKKLRVEEIYNSVPFYPDFSREATPIDFIPTDMG